MRGVARVLVGLIVVVGAAVAMQAWAQSGDRLSGVQELIEEPIIGATRKEVAITTTFSGAELFVYGAVARDRRVMSADGALDVIVIVEGPSSPIIVRKKEWIAGLWINAASIRIAAAPSFYGVASTRPIDKILREQDDATYGVSLQRAVLFAGMPTSAPDPGSFREAAIRLRRKQGLYVELPTGVSLQGETLFEARFQLPANITEGEYIATVHLVRGRRIIASNEVPISVRRRGIEQFLYEAAINQPTLYALGTLLTALLAGYGASELFRRLRR